MQFGRRWRRPSNSRPEAWEKRARMPPANAGESWNALTLKPHHPDPVRSRFMTARDRPARRIWPLVDNVQSYEAGKA